MNKSISWAAVLMASILVVPVSADSIIPSGTISSQAVGADFEYSIVLENSPLSKGPIGTFWFAWVPGPDFLATSPLSITTPDGWKVKITNTGPNDGFAIQWVDVDPLKLIQPGGSLDFGFLSADSPTVMAGNSPTHPTFPILTSFVYPGAPFSDAGHEFLIRAVPEPSSLLLAAGGIVTLASTRLRCWRKGRTMAQDETAPVVA